MPAPKGNQYAKGNKGGGRDTIEKEIEHTKEKLKERAIEEVAESVLHKRLKKLDKVEDKQGEKDIALPVYLKSKADKVNLNGNLKINFDGTFNTT